MEPSFEQLTGRRIERLTDALRLITFLPVDPVGALEGVRRILGNLKTYSPEATLYLSILEELRKPLRETVITLAKKSYRDHPLPQMEQEETAFSQVISALRQMNQAYRHCGQLLSEEENERLHAQVLHRNIYYTSAIVFEYYRARQDLPAGIWREIHGYYELAELRGLADRPIADPLKKGQSISCMANYITLLLVEIANPYSYSADTQELIYRLARLGAPLARIEPLDSMLDIPPFILDLDEDAPLHTPDRGEVSDTARFLNTHALTRQMEETRARLLQSDEETIAIGDDQEKVPRAPLLKIIEALRAPWAQTRITRRFHRRAGKGQIAILMDFAPIHLAVSGAPFTPPQGGYIYHDRMISTSEDAVRFGILEDRQLAGSNVQHQRQELQMSRLRAHSDKWEMINQSASGFRLSRSLIGARTAYGQLLSLPLPDTDKYVLAKVSWLMQNASGLHMGISLLPGFPEACAVALLRDEEDANNNDGINFGLKTDALRYERAFLLPGIPGVNLPSSLVLPHRLGRPDAPLSLAAGGNVVRVLVKETLFRGYDFVEVTYTAQ
ncbi:MAG: hypothetical protein LBG69_06650 [Zoogloeaceae bacterium]|jgi:hypothetical protein|nr:hypothetical protein [Zoogloeaceae bacterium]